MIGKGLCHLSIFYISRALQEEINGKRRLVGKACWCLAPKATVACGGGECLGCCSARLRQPPQLSQNMKVS